MQSIKQSKWTLLAASVFLVTAVYLFCKPVPIDQGALNSMIILDAKHSVVKNLLPMDNAEIVESKKSNSKKIDNYLKLTSLKKTLTTGEFLSMIQDLFLTHPEFAIEQLKNRIAESKNIKIRRVLIAFPNRMESSEHRREFSYWAITQTGFKLTQEEWYSALNTYIGSYQGSDFKKNSIKLNAELNAKLKKIFDQSNGSGQKEILAKTIMENTTHGQSRIAMAHELEQITRVPASELLNILTKSEVKIKPLDTKR